MLRSLIRSHLAPGLLCLALLLSLTACGGKTGSPPAAESGGVTETHPGDQGNTGGSSPPETDSEQGKTALARLRACIERNDHLAGAVAYLGNRAQGDAVPLADWLRENCSGLTAELPFLPEIPAERTLGAGYGDLYCVVPRDESTSLAVNRVAWESLENGVRPVVDEVLYREEHARPVLVFVNFEMWPEEPDTEICLVTENGLEVSWYPLINGFGCPVVPTGADDAPMLMDFAFFGDITGLDYPEGWEPAGDDWWLPPTNIGLADTAWVCDDWMLDLHYGNGDPDYAGIAEFYRRTEDSMELKLAYAGVWRMEDDCLRVEFFPDDGAVLGGSFPILISPSGEDLYFQRSRSGEGLPFLEDGVDSVGLTLSVG